MAKIESNNLVREAVKKTLERYGWSETQLSEHCGGMPSQPRINRYLNGKIDLSGRSVERILQALGYKVDANGHLVITRRVPKAKKK